MLRKCLLRHSHSHANVLIRSSKKDRKIVVQDFCIYLQHRRKTIGYIIRDRVFILFIHQNGSRNNLNSLCNLSGS